MVENRNLGDTLLDTADYARVVNVRGQRMIELKGRCTETFGDAAGKFHPSEIRDLAKFLLELADDAENDPAVQELTSALKALSSWDATYENTARKLIRMGYHK